MSGQGSIIIHDLIENPGTQIADKQELKRILERYKASGSFDLLDRIYLVRLAWRLSK